METPPRQLVREHQFTTPKHAMTQMMPLTPQSLPRTPASSSSPPSSLAFEEGALGEHLYVSVQEALGKPVERPNVPRSVGDILPDEHRLATPSPSPRPYTSSYAKSQACPLATPQASPYATSYATPQASVYAASYPAPRASPYASSYASPQSTPSTSAYAASYQAPPAAAVPAPAPKPKMSWELAHIIGFVNCLPAGRPYAHSKYPIFDECPEKKRKEILTKVDIVDYDGAGRVTRRKTEQGYVRQERQWYQSYLAYGRYIRTLPTEKGITSADFLVVTRKFPIGWDGTSTSAPKDPEHVVWRYQIMVKVIRGDRKEMPEYSCVLPSSGGKDPSWDDAINGLKEVAHGFLAKWEHPNKKHAATTNVALLAHAAPVARPVPVQQATPTYQSRARSPAVTRAPPTPGCNQPYGPRVQVATYPYDPPNPAQNLPATRTPGPTYVPSVPARSPRPAGNNHKRSFGAFVGQPGQLPGQYGYASSQNLLVHQPPPYPQTYQFGQIR